MFEDKMNEYVAKLVQSVVKPIQGETALVVGDILSRRIQELFSLHLAKYEIPAVILSARQGFLKEWLLHIPEKVLLELPRNLSSLVQTSNIIIVIGSIPYLGRESDPVPSKKLEMLHHAMVKLNKPDCLGTNRCFFIPLPSLENARKFNYNYEFLLNKFWKLADIDYEAYTLKTMQLIDILHQVENLKIGHPGIKFMDILITGDTRIYLDGKPIHDDKKIPRNIYILPKGELLFENIELKNFDKNWKFHVNPQRTFKTPLIHVNQNNETDSNATQPLTTHPLHSSQDGYKFLLSVGLNGSIQKPCGYPFIDSKLVGNAILHVKKENTLFNLAYYHLYTEYFRLFENIDFIINDKKIMEKGKIVF